MSFKIKTYEKKNFEKAVFMQLTHGIHVVRFLEPTEDALLITQHYIPTARTSVACLGDECPICGDNRKIYLEDNKNFRNQPGYLPKSDKYVINVLDKTLVKVCPNCSAEVKKIDKNFPATCPECNTFIVNVDAKPVNKIKLLSLSKTLATEINGIEEATQDAQGNPLGLTSYDIAFSVTEVGGKKNTTPIPSLQNQEPITIDKEALIDKNLATVRLTAEEITDLRKGVSLKDIFTARRTNTPVTAQTTEAVTPSTPSKVDEDLEDKIRKQLGFS